MASLKLRDGRSGIGGIGGERHARLQVASDEPQHDSLAGRRLKLADSVRCTRGGRLRWLSVRTGCGVELTLTVAAERPV